MQEKSIQENLLGKTYSGKLIQEPYSRKNLFMKTIGHTKSLRKWPVDVLNSIFAKCSVDNRIMLCMIGHAFS